MNGPRPRRTSNTLRAAWAYLGHRPDARRLAELAALPSVLAAWVVLNNISAGFYSGGAVPATYSLSGAAVVSIMALSLSLALATARKLVRMGRRPWLAYSATLILASIATGVGQWYVRDLLGLQFSLFETADNVGWRRLTMFVTASDTFILGSIVMLVYTRRRRELESLRALHKMQLKRQGLERDLLQSRLAATEAMVDPEGLLRDLRNIKTAYEEGRGEAEAELNELIDRLRARLSHTTAIIELTNQLP
jgi:hypothetical protein